MSPIRQEDQLHSWQHARDAFSHFGRLQTCHLPLPSPVYAAFREGSPAGASPTALKETETSANTLTAFRSPRARRAGSAGCPQEQRVDPDESVEIGNTQPIMRWRAPGPVLVADEKAKRPEQR